MAESIRRSDWDPDVRTSLERRRTPRTPFLVRVRYGTVDALFSEFARNVNEGGLFIEAEHPLPPETRVALHFQLPGSSEPIQTEGRVAWIRTRAEGEPPGMGVEFDDLSVTDRARINELIRSLRARERGDDASDAGEKPKP